MRWATDPSRPWAGVSPLQRAVDTASLSGWIDKRLSEEASGPVGSFLPVAKYDADADADLDADDADDPLALLRRDIGGSAWANVLASRVANGRRRILRPVPHAKIFRSQRFGANPPRDLVELRQQVGRDVGVRVRRCRTSADSTALPPGKRRAKPGGSLSRHRLTGSAVGSKRRSSTKLGVEVCD